MSAELFSSSPNVSVLIFCLKRRKSGCVERFAAKKSWASIHLANLVCGLCKHCNVFCIKPHVLCQHNPVHCLSALFWSWWRPWHKDNGMSWRARGQLLCAPNCPSLTSIPTTFHPFQTFYSSRWTLNELRVIIRCLHCIANLLAFTI